MSVFSVAAAALLYKCATQGCREQRNRRAKKILSLQTGFAGRNYNDLQLMLGRNERAEIMQLLYLPGRPLR